jgi:hypothetical protein|tara:strand:+ start:14701 stop:14901 length:201 start_codon:yes stop_codon:yes gene_type:complete
MFFLIADAEKQIPSRDAAKRDVPSPHIHHDVVPRVGQTVPGDGFRDQGVRRLYVIGVVCITTFTLA